MNTSVLRADAAQHQTPLLAVPFFDGDAADAGLAALDTALGGQIAGLRTRGDLPSKEGDTLLLFPAAGGAVAAERVLLIAAGKAGAVTHERLRKAAGTAAKQAAKLRQPGLAFLLPASSLAHEDAVRAVVEGLTLGSYVFDQLKTRAEGAKEPVALADAAVLVPEGADVGGLGETARTAEIIARAENFARTLGNLPGNVATPSYLAAEAERLGREHGMKVTVLGPDEMEDEKMGALLAVARGSDEEPRFMVLEHRRGPEGQAPLVLVGKGLTFDAGGISIKPAAGMEEMKFDMCGGAGVLGAMQAIGELGVPVNVIGIVPSSENLLGGRAMKPGDIFTALSGKTIEVVNTDAEGRLILADALAYAKRFSPAAVLDAATLTGACVVALGNHATGVMGNDEGLIAEVLAAGTATGERCWALPMFDEYRDQIKSDYADIKNSGGRPAGAITAGWFLREFVDYPWVHLDVAGTAYSEGKPAYLAKGATGVPTRLFVQWVLSRAGA